MRLPWRTANVTKLAEQAREAKESAERDYQRVVSETPKFRRLGEQVRAIREDNHLLQAFDATMGGRQ